MKRLIFITFIFLTVIVGCNADDSKEDSTYENTESIDESILIQNRLLFGKYKYLVNISAYREEIYIKIDTIFTVSYTYVEGTAGVSYLKKYDWYTDSSRVYLKEIATGEESIIEYELLDDINYYVMFDGKNYFEIMP